MSAPPGVCVQMTSGLKGPRHGEDNNMVVQYDEDFSKMLLWHYFGQKYFYCIFINSGCFTLFYTVINQFWLG